MNRQMQFYRSKKIVAAAKNNNINCDSETEKRLPANNGLIKFKALSTSSSQNNTAINPKTLSVIDPEELITFSDLDDSVEDPDFELPESVKDTSSDTDFTFRDFLGSCISQSAAESLHQNRQPEIHFVAAYPGPVFTYNEHDNLSNTSTTQNANPQYVNATEPNVMKPNKNKIKHPMIVNSCDGKCKRQCAKFSVESRKEIWDKYWERNFVSRRNFLNKCITICSIKRRKVQISNSNNSFSKNESRYFSLPNKDNELIPVCRNFFLATLAYKTDGVITELSKSIKKGILNASASKENRGGNRRKVDGSIITEHIMSFQPTVSHYRRHNAPFTKYLPRHLTLQQMYKDFKQKNPNFKCGVELYRQNIKKLKISFHMPKGDSCVECSMYEQELKNYSDVNSMPEKIRTKYENHKFKADSALQRYRLDGSSKNSNRVKYLSMDLQKVIILPEMPEIKDAFFMSRLVTFNLTFAPIEKKSSEAQAGREASDIMNAIYAFIQANRDMEHLYIWADNCTAQNKNWTLYTAMIIIVNNSLNNLKSVTISYLTKGHTHMSADAVHGNIEMKMRRQRNIYDFQDFKDTVMQSRRNIKPIEINCRYEWPKKKRVARLNEPLKQFNLNSVVQVEFSPGSRNLFYKTRFDEPLQELDFLVKKFNCTELPKSLDTPRGIKQNKKEEIINKLVCLMPESRKSFWNNLPVNDSSADLTNDGQMSAVE
ncbi:unnamed protein product [Parnassius mnemosyne]|uniref:DUF7869 domain-containing protein n=1 Tax=Parnassius mnemosyne TaxID=213953 RepID=A0AAV1L3H4_9NEOP